ncbi:MAG: leucyl/phenylalanyl-tRNA--protein transferase [Gallionellaceae bacterium CG1_02_56_997]|nr:MAG: leucyl/phenylalanyl-tRNA--protein transferase [Gallionellaceae bacterium CG1_02_56_997]
MIPWLTEDTPFPPVTQALREPNGLLAASLSLSPERLLEAYRQGIFPWFSPGDPVLWWSPSPRMVLIPDEFIISKSLAKVLRNSNYQVRTDTSFERVMRACAAPRSGQAGTWIDEQMIAAYCALHQQGFAHSVETWVNDRLVGGLYGVAIGQMFYGESMFSSASNASKIALAHLTRQLLRWQNTSITPMIDCQMHTPHLASLGAKQIPRSEFIALLEVLINLPPRTSWQFDTDLFQ